MFNKKLNTKVLTFTNPGSRSGDSAALGCRPAAAASLPTMEGMDVALMSPSDVKSADRFTEDLDPLVESSEAMLYFLSASFSRKDAIGVLRFPKPLAELALRPRVGFPR